MLRKQKQTGIKEYSTNPELRYKATSEEWVVIAPKRSQKIKKADFKERKKKRVVSPIKTCPFENPQASGNADPYFWYPSDKPIEEWEFQVFENKFPALTHNDHTCAIRYEKGIRSTIQGRGYHDLIITRSHTDNFSDLGRKKAADVLEAMTRRYKDVMTDECVHYVSVFQNWGDTAGASVYHPHYQMISLPVVPTHVARSLDSSARYWAQHKSCIHCAILQQEQEDQSRIIYENDRAIAFVPFAAKEPFQVNIFPRDHHAYFEDAGRDVLEDVADAMAAVLRSVRDNIGDPDYNFFLHTAPTTNKKEHHHYHWHFEVIPKSNISAGFELGTGIEINPVVPEEAAQILRI